MILNTVLLREMWNMACFCWHHFKRHWLCREREGKGDFISANRLIHAVIRLTCTLFAKILPIRNHNLVMFVILWHVDLVIHLSKAECKISWSSLLHAVVVSTSFACNRVINVNSKATFTLPNLNTKKVENKFTFVFPCLCFASSSFYSNKWWNNRILNAISTSDEVTGAIQLFIKTKFPLFHCSFIVLFQ